MIHILTHQQIEMGGATIVTTGEGETLVLLLRGKITDITTLRRTDLAHRHPDSFGTRDLMIRDHTLTLGVLVCHRSDQQLRGPVVLILPLF